LLVVTTEYTELQPLLSGVHSVMRVKFALAGEGGGARPRPPPFITFTITSKVAVYAPAEWADTLTLFHLLENMYSVVVTLIFPLHSCLLNLLSYPISHNMTRPRFRTYQTMRPGKLSSLMLD
jgi:hypothetical protein